MKTIIIDINKCIGCRDCQLACKDEHVANDWMPITKPQAENQFWLKVTETEQGSQPKMTMDWIPVLCMHCQEAPCISSCSEKAIYRREDGIVIIDPERCNGCKNCMPACPYGVIYFNDALKIGQKCTMCAHLLDRGRKEPRCVNACPTEAMIFGEVDELNSYLTRSEDLKPETACRPLVKYIGVPRPFIAGEVYSPKENECLEGVKVTLTNTLTGEKKNVMTDNYGDFWLRELGAEIYSITIEKAGYYPKQISNLNVTEKSLNLGSIRLYPRST